MPLGLVIAMLLLATYFGARVWAYLRAGGFSLPGRWRVTRAKDPITFWSVVIAYGTVSAVIAVGALVGAVFGKQHISN